MIKPLTSLRFVFALMVFCCHSNILENSEHEAVRLFYKNVMLEGYIGVSFFFILSGFILSYSYQEQLRKGSRQLSDFFIGRVARIYPLHLLCAVIAIPITVFYKSGQGIGQLAGVFVANAALVHSFIPLEEVYMSFNAPDWSISNEMFFYAMFPFLLGAGVWKLKGMQRLLVIFAVFGFSVLVMSILPRGIQHAICYVSPFMRILDFVLGMLLYNVWKEGRQDNKKLNPSLSEVVAVAVFVVFFYFHSYVPQVFRYSVYYWVPMMGIVYVFASQSGVFSRLLSHKWLLYLGEISFGFYIIHQLVIRYWNFINVRYIHVEDVVAQLVIIFLISITFAAISFRYFEHYANSKVKKYLSAQHWLAKAVSDLQHRLLKN